MIRWEKVVLKRSLDVCLSSLLLLAALPVLLVCAILIKLDSEGSVFFRQARMGRGFRTFELIKLRTMDSATRGCRFTFGADPRVTRVGYWLRKFKFDELPQLWNVLRGDMSIVGPRPVVPELTLEFREEYEELLSVRPGLTDPATLKYRDEAEMLGQFADPMEHFKTVVTPDKLRISRAYLRHANVRTDLILIGKTAMSLLALLSAHGSGEAPAAAPEFLRRTSPSPAREVRRTPEAVAKSELSA